MVIRHLSYWKIVFMCSTIANGSFHTMADRHAQLQAAYVSRRTVTGLDEWLQHNRRQTDHNGQLRAYVAEKGQLYRVRRVQVDNVT